VAHQLPYSLAQPADHLGHGQYHLHRWVPLRSHSFQPLHGSLRMSEKQAGVVGRWRSRAEVDRLVAEFEASGLTRQEFCTKHGLSLVTLDRYRKRRQQRGEKFAGDSGFLQVELSAPKAADS